MGRNRTFDEAEVVAACASAFRSTGYEGTSIDDLVRASGLHRGSLYKAFGSKRGLFLQALGQIADSGSGDDDSTDLLLVALMELAPRDAEIGAIVSTILAHSRPQHTAASLGARLLNRAGLTTPDHTPPKDTP
ncbi:TetR/AcrR family transcriptional regulator [Herbiconiux liukaitaii]|uniref:TetR/AcrR family transcriptional regulator n=1 Tax=Herbiconiux liukaitaii TaxID=3342799 RepID=UPI0035B81A4E